MGKHATFGRPGALDRLRLWWYARDRSSRMNWLVGLAVGGIAVGLVAAAVAREPAPGTGLVNATRPHLTSGPLPNPPMTVDIQAASGPATPLGLADQSSSTSSTVAAAPVLPTVAGPTGSTTQTARPTTAATTAARVALPADPGPQVVYTEVPVQTTATVPPLPTTTRPPASVPAAPTTVPSSTSPTTAVTLLPPISLPPLLP